jgi:hypothetical protein
MDFMYCKLLISGDPAYGLQVITVALHVYKAGSSSDGRADTLLYIDICNNHCLVWFYCRKPLSEDNPPLTLTTPSSVTMISKPAF